MNEALTAGKRHDGCAFRDAADKLDPWDRIALLDQLGKRGAFENNGRKPDPTLGFYVEQMYAWGSSAWGQVFSQEGGTFYDIKIMNGKVTETTNCSRDNKTPVS